MCLPLTRRREANLGIQAHRDCGEMPPLGDIKSAAAALAAGLDSLRGELSGQVGRLSRSPECETGHVAWKTKVVDYHDRFALTMAPVVVHGLVIVGSSGVSMKYAARWPLRRPHGEEVWRFRTTSGGVGPGTHF